VAAVVEGEVKGETGLDEVVVLIFGLSVELLLEVVGTAAVVVIGAAAEAGIAPAAAGRGGRLATAVVLAAVGVVKGYVRVAVGEVIGDGPDGVDLEESTETG